MIFVFIVRASAVIDGQPVAKLNSIEVFNNPKDASRHNSLLLKAFVDTHCGRGLSISVDRRKPEMLHNVAVDDVGVNLLQNIKTGRRVVSDVAVVGRLCRLDLEVVDAEVHHEFPHIVTVDDALVVADPSCSAFDGSTVLINNVVPGSWRFTTTNHLTLDGVRPRELIFSTTARPHGGWEPVGSVNVVDGLVGVFDSRAFTHAIDDHKRWYAEQIVPNLDELVIAADANEDHFVAVESGHAVADYNVYTKRDASSRVAAVKVDFMEEV